MLLTTIVHIINYKHLDHQYSPNLTSIKTYDITNHNSNFCIKIFLSKTRYSRVSERKLDIKNNKGQTPLEASEAISSRSAMTDLLKAGKRLVNPVSPLASPVPPLDTTSNSNNNSNLGKTLVVVVGIFGLGIIIFRVTRPEEEKAPQSNPEEIKTENLTGMELSGFYLFYHCD